MYSDCMINIVIITIWERNMIHKIVYNNQTAVSLRMPIGPEVIRITYVLVWQAPM